MSGSDAAVQVQAGVLQDAVVLHPRVLALVHFMKQPQTVWVFHSQWGQIRVVSGDIHPHVVLKHEGLIDEINQQPDTFMLIHSYTQQHAATPKPLDLSSTCVMGWIAFSIASSHLNKYQQYEYDALLRMLVVLDILICTLPFHFLVRSGTEEEHSTTRLRAALKHKWFSQGWICSHLSPFQLHR